MRRMRSILCLTLVTTICVHISCVRTIKVPDAGYETNATVYYKDGNVSYSAGTVDSEHGVAYALFRNELTINGWGVLDVVSGYGTQKQSDNMYMYAAGYLEGALTYKHIYNQYKNTRSIFLGGKSKSVVSTLMDFFNKQQDFMKEMVAANLHDPFWRNAGLILSQYSGLVDGYHHAAPKEMALDSFAFQFTNSFGDLIDLINVVDKEGRPDFDNMSLDELKLYVTRNSHCSVLIKVLGAYENIFFSHSTWSYYQTTDRIFKYYDFNIDELASKKVSFSSYPGYLSSWDDFYLMENGLVTLQTTNTVYNMSLYNSVHPKSVPAWIRVRVANQKSANSSQWGAWLQMFNSGTYNNQYMILDLNRVKLNVSIEDGALSVVEQIPGLVMWADQTQTLRRGYWPSYNVPFYEEVYNRSGYPSIVKTRGLDFSYQLAPRAKIFRRDAGKVTDMESMKHIMRYNDYKNDPYSEGDACNTICCRGDLSKDMHKLMGCTDTKVADFHMASQRYVSAINGPTRGDSLAPFSWSQYENTSHIGLPDVYNFDFMLMTPGFN